MTAFDRFERSLPALLEDLAVPRLPDYADDLFARTAATRQRSGWSFAERWLPMSAITRSLAAVPRFPWRLGVLVALLALAAIIVVILAGSQSPRLPAPFGPAANGTIPYISNGNLFLGDLTSGDSRLLADGSGDMGLPQFSPDGTRVAYLQVATGVVPPAINVYVIRPDGSGVTLVTPQPIDDAGWKWIGWAPDSRRIGVVHPVGGVNQLDFFDASGNGKVERLAAAAGLDSVSFRPPDAAEILFRAGVTDASGTLRYDLYAMNADGSNVRKIATSAVEGDSLDLTGATYTPDGKRIFVNRWTSDASVGEAGCCQLYVMNADGSAQQQFVPNTGEAWDGQAVVSPDGTRIAFWHNPNERPDHGVFVIRSDGTGPLIETGPRVGGLRHWVWSPDSSTILMYLDDSERASAYLLDPEGGPWTMTPWRQDGDIDWQRLALP